MGPKKPHRSSSTSESAITNYFSSVSTPHMFLETSFTSLQSPSSNSSITNGYFSTKSQHSPLSLRQPLSNLNFSFKSNRSDTSFKSQRLSLTKVKIIILVWSNNVKVKHLARRTPVHNEKSKSKPCTKSGPNPWWLVGLSASG